MIDRSYIENWARTVPAKAEFPELVLRLVQASIPSCQNKVDIPIGSSTYMGGWDGWIDTKEGTTYIPQGLSGWEFGTEDLPQTKANRDYSTRTDAENPPYVMADTTFVFVTPYIWAKKDEWISEKKKEGKWKDIVVYDSDSLSQWLLMAPCVERWLALKVGARPATGYYTTEEKWDCFIYGNKPFQLTPEFYTCGRESVVRELERQFQSKQPFILGIEASSREEALAFILASGKQLSKNEQEIFKSKSMVVDEKTAFQELMNHHVNMCLIPEVSDYGMAFSARGNGHSVIVPLSQDDEFTSNKIKLPVSNKNRLVDILVSYGINKPEAERLVRDNSCNIALIRKGLDFPPFRADWQKTEDIRELIPALLLGKWSDGFKGDEEALALLAGKDYKEYHARLVYWSKLPVSPIINIGNAWRTTSPLSFWSTLSDTIKDEQTNLLSGLFEKVFVKSDNEYSSQIKKGILENLIIIALYGKGMGIVEDGQKWTDTQVGSLMNSDDPKKWVEFSDYMPLLAEASPSVFTNCVQSAITNHKDVMAVLFEEKESFITPESHHTNLLWALESLAWLPEYLQPVTEILLRLSEMDPGGRLSNRPFNSLTTIYLSWLPQTSVSLNRRLSVLDDCIKKSLPMVWDLLVALLPQPNAVSMGTYHLKWREFGFEERKDVDYEEVFKTTEWIVEKMMSVFDGRDANLGNLIEKMEPIPHSVRTKLIDWLPIAVEQIKDNEGAQTRKALRETLWYQNLDGIKNQYSFTGEELNKVNEAYEKLTPSDLGAKHLWLFEEDFPHLPQKFEKDPDDDYANIQQIVRIRKEACDEMFENYDVDAVLKLKDKVKEPRTFGATLAQYHSREGLTDKVCNLLGNGQDLHFVGGYLCALESIIGEEKMLSIYKECEAKGFSANKLVEFLLCLSPVMSLWLFVKNQNTNIQDAYWKKTQGCFWGPYKDDVDYQITQFIEAGRAVDALNRSWIYANNLSTNLIQSLLNGVLYASTELNHPLDHLALGRMMEEIHKRDDADQDLLLKFEWNFLPALLHGHDDVCLDRIYSQLSKVPSFFVDLLTFLYKPDDGDDEETDTDEAIRGANASRAFHLFYHWDKIPYVSQEGVVDVQGLTDWVKEALIIAKEKKRIIAAYIQLGGLFAHYGEDGEHASDLFSIMETIDSTLFFNNYRVGLFNKRGYTVRAPYEGGEIERGNEFFFKDLHERYHVQYPKVAKVFKDLAVEYAEMAKQMDEEADLTKLDY